MKYKGISIIKRKDCNSWSARFRKNGKQFTVSAKTQTACYNKLKVAMKKQEEIAEKLKRSNSLEPNAITFEDWFNKWLVLYKQNVKDGTKKEYFICLKYLNNVANLPINKITAINLMEQLNNIPGERTKQKVYEIASAIFEKALQNELIIKNPMAFIDKPKHKRINGLALSNEDEQKLENILISENLDLYLICLYQGLRRGEMLALTIADIDFTNKTLTINKSLNKKSQFDTTKNESSIRTMPLFDKTIKLLTKYKDRPKDERVFGACYGSSDKKFRKIINENFANKKYTLHSLRHTFITKCQEAGVPLHIIQRWVGHTIGSNVTNSVYTHSRELAELENIEKINNYK